MTTLSTTAIQELPSTLAPLLNKARRKPVALSHNGKTAAFLVSARTYQQMVKTAEMMEEAEDKYWAKMAEESIDDMKKHPPISEEETRKLLDDIINS